MNWLQRIAMKLIKNPFGVFSLLFFSLVAASAVAGFTPNIDDYVILNSYIDTVIPSALFWTVMLLVGIAGCYGIGATKPRLISITSMITVIGHSFIFFVLLYTDHITSQAVRSPWIVAYAAYIFFVVGLRKTWWDD